jgi:N-acetylglucosaminyldiphosphoundecaprenol N-acetyl-beta-D-mannosaminyltransferase
MLAPCPIDPVDDVLLLDRREAPRTCEFLSVDFTPLAPQTLFERVVETASRRVGFHYLVTPNVDQIVRLHKNEESRILHQDAWANVNDSRILEALAARSGLDLPACPGSDLTARILSEAIDPQERVVIIGCKPDVVAAITARFGLTDVHWYQPPMGLRTNPDAIAETARFCVDNPARFYFLCVGSPQQEMVARAIKLTGQATGLGLCVGASLEFLAGARQRAPGWMQKARLEWLFRLLSEPKVLWRRYLVEGPRIFALWLSWHKSHQAQ